MNHNIIIEKLSDMGVESWLLRIVISFLKDRNMFVKHIGGQSSIKPLPGGGPQGTILALLLFLVLVNDVGFHEQANKAGELATSKNKVKVANEIHLKFVDDLTLAESINLSKNLVKKNCPDPNLLDDSNVSSTFSLPSHNSKVFQQLQETSRFAASNDMKIKFRKTKQMLFNTSKIIFSLEGQNIE